MSITTMNTKIKTILDTLSAAEVNALKIQLDFNDSIPLQNNNKSTFTVDELLFWDALTEAMHNVRLGKIGSPSNYIGSGRNMITRHDLTDRAIALRDYVTHACSIDIDRAHRRAIYVEVITCLIKWMRRGYTDGMNGRRITPVTICQDIGQIPQAVNICYPSYVASRMLHVIVPLNEDNGRLRVA